MATLYLDPNAFLRGAPHRRGGTRARPAADAASVGHVHLSVGDVATARSFYVDALGFDETAGLGNQAVFVSAGGYHHHMAMNVWNSRGAGPRMPALGLGRVDLALPDADALGALGERLRHHGFEVRDDGRALPSTTRGATSWSHRVGLTLASDAVADDQLRLEDRDVTRVAPGEKVEQHARHPLTLREGGLAHRGELRGARLWRPESRRSRSIAMSSGTRMPSRASTASAPRAMRSLATKIASGRSTLSRMRRIAAAPPSAVKSAVLDGIPRRRPCAASASR